MGTAGASFAVVVLIVAGAVGLASMQMGSQSVTIGPAQPGAVVLAAGTTFNVSSSYDCVASHYEVPLVAHDHSVLSGGFNAGMPGVTVYVATAQEASTVSDSHPSTWLYSTGLQTSASFTVPLSSGSYVAWIEGADENCGATLVMPLEQLTMVNVTQAFAVTDALATTTPNSLCTTPVQPSNASGTADVYVLTPGTVGAICVGYQFRSSGTYSFSTPDFGPLNGSSFQACGPGGSFNGTTLAPCEHLSITGIPGSINHSGPQNVTVAYTIRADSDAGGLYWLFIGSCDPVVLAIGTAPASVPAPVLLCVSSTQSPSGETVTGVSNVSVAEVPIN